MAGGLLAMTSFSASASAQPRASFEQLRQRMVQEFVLDCGVRDDRVVEAMQKTPRHEFVPVRYRDQAYTDSAIPIGESQTISSPFIVAYMTESLDPRPTDRVLEIGTGSGYQAAVLAAIVDQVYTIEIVEELGEQAAETLDRLDYENVHVRVGDGFQGWAEHAPFDKIIVTCSPERVPQPLIDQLAEGGRMIIPVGERYQQSLYLFRKVNGQLESEALRPTLFVPMT
ncbi:MAG: protein-L-isoaspartate(D-aspartate) O-methyltransferase, partial [Planctomycetales bacterium]|nr:protein-L-isoaspartate(D-aspartate) O-methyltransferase [Planctomycetales bacterium]